VTFNSPNGVEQSSLTLSGHRLLSNLAEVSIPKIFLAEILRLIAKLRPPPDPAPAEGLGYHGFQRKPQERCVLQKTKSTSPTLKALASATLLQSSPGGDDVATVRNCLCPHMVPISAQQAAHPVDAD